MNNVACRIIRHLCCIAVLGALVGCAAPRVPPGIPSSYDPVLGILYYPFAKGEDQHVARPQPDRSGWTRGRMDMDLRRMGKAELDVVFVVLDAAGLERFQVERVAHFVRLAAELEEDVPRVAVWIRGGDDVTPSKVRRLILMLVQSGAPNSTGWFRMDGRPLLLLEGRGSTSSRHPAFSVRQAGPSPTTWAAPDGAQRNAEFGGNGRQALVSAGYWDGETSEWIVERNGGRTFREQLWQAVMERPEIIVLSSWNAFHRGDFLAPNTLDGEKAYNHLIREGQWLK